MRAIQSLQFVFGTICLFLFLGTIGSIAIFAISFGTICYSAIFFWNHLFQFLTCCSAHYHIADKSKDNSSYCSVLQRVAACCSVLQCALTYCRQEQRQLVRIAVCCSVLQCVAVCYSVLQRVAVCTDTLQTRAKTTRPCCSELQCVAVCCSVDLHIADKSKDNSSNSVIHYSRHHRTRTTHSKPPHPIPRDSQHAQYHPSNRSCAVCCSVLQSVVVCCSELQCVAVYRSYSQHAQYHPSNRFCVVCCSVMQCVVACCGVLGCVAVSCSVP